MITVTYSWWTMSASKGSVTIQTANIATKITLYQGIDYNYDGIMDRGIDESLPKVNQNETNGRYVEVSNAQTVNEETNVTNLCLNFPEVIPTAIYTWKLVVENRGDAPGYLRAQISKNLVDEGNNSSSIFDYFKFFTVNGAQTDRLTGLYNAEYAYTSRFIGIDYFKLDDASKSSYLSWNIIDEMTTKINVFGNTENDRIMVGETKVYVFRFQLRPFDTLLEAGLVAESDRSEYQALQGKIFNSQTPLLDIILSTDPPEVMA
jgi:hypothetical protein